MSRDVVVAALAGLVALAGLRMARGYPWPLAGIVALSIAALVYSTYRSMRRIRSASRSSWRIDDGSEGDR